MRVHSVCSGCASSSRSESNRKTQEVKCPHWTSLLSPSLADSAGGHTNETRETRDINHGGRVAGAAEQGRTSCDRGRWPDVTCEERGRPTAVDGCGCHHARALAKILSSPHSHPRLGCPQDPKKESVPSYGRVHVGARCGVGARIAPPFMEATDTSRLVCVVVVSYQEYSLTHFMIYCCIAVFPPSFYSTYRQAIKIARSRMARKSEETSEVWYPTLRAAVPNPGRLKSGVLPA